MADRATRAGELAVVRARVACGDAAVNARPDLDVVTGPRDDGPPLGDASRPLQVPSGLRVRPDTPRRAAGEAGDRWGAIVGGRARPGLVAAAMTGAAGSYPNRSRRALRDRATPSAATAALTT